MKVGHDIPGSSAPLAEGKTKRIWRSETPGHVLVESKDDITSGDGAKRDEIAGKAELATETTANVFELLEKVGIPTHYIGREDDRTFRAEEVSMIPIELVTRRVAFGSYLKRNPNVVSQTKFESPEFEMFAKDDSKHDPLLRYDFEGQYVYQYKAGQPVSDDSLLSIEPFDVSMFPLDWYMADKLRQHAIDVFEVLEAAWKDQEVTLVDMKIECGLTQDGRIVVADVIDNDSWRIWPGGNPNQMVDKQLYRDGQSLDYVADKYAWVAAATKEFVREA